MRQTFLRNSMDHEHEGIVTTGNVFSVAIAAHDRYLSFLGNVFGQPGDSGDYEGAGNCAGGPAAYKLGWPSDFSAGHFVKLRVHAHVKKRGGVVRS